MISKRTLKIGNHATLEYGNKHGAFGTYSTKNGSCPSGVHHCREVFSHYFTKDKKHVVFLSDTSIDRISEFWDTLEKTIKIGEKTLIHPTNRPNVIIFSLSSFWLGSATRRSLVTLFIRAATYYDGNFKRALERYPLTRQCSRAIEYFLGGNVKASDIDIGNGFVSKFRGKDTDFIKEHLVKKTKTTLDDFEVATEF